MLIIFQRGGCPFLGRKDSMEYGYDFEIGLIPIHLNSANNNPLIKFSNIISEEAVACLGRIYSEINKRMLTSKNHSLIDKIHNGVFCCCFATGATIFTIRLNMTGGLLGSQVCLSGYFIPTDSLKTAWKVFRREIITICIGGADALEDNVIMMDDIKIFDSAYKTYIGLNEELKAKADKIANDMENVSVPYSFAYTDFPLKYMPVIFESSGENHIEYAEGVDSNKIIFTTDQVRKKKAELYQFYPDAENMYLVVNNRKTYLNLKKEEYKNTLSKAEFKSKSRELDIRADIQRDYLWFWVKKADFSYVYLVNGDEYIRPLEFGNTEFPLIPMLMKQANSDIDRRRYERATTATQTADGKKSGGLFSNWSHKKK